MRAVAVAAAAAALVLVPSASGLRPAPVLTLPEGFAAELYATGLKRPTALAFGPDGLLYATQETGEVVAVGRGSGRPRVLARGPDGRIYLGSGSTCDACQEKDRRSAAILSLERDGSDVRVEARGLRNPYGLAFRPGTARLYVSD